jgi:hypothetical protein
MRKMKWTISRYRRLFWDCGLDPFYRLQSLRARIREEKKARRHLKIGRPRIWTIRQAASAINTWGISYEHFPRQAEYREEEDRPKKGFPAASSEDEYVKALQKGRLDDAAENCDLPGAPIQITDPGVQLLSNWQ